jgi:UDP-GlcNAc:undecaprenyl-phosphate GlcNAc-1-phosphate transferase
VRRLALRLSVVDHPERRKMHQVPVPLLGGAAIVVSFTAVAWGVYIWTPDLLGEQAGKLPALLLASLAVSLLGAYDDWRGVRASVKFLFQSLAAGALVIAGFHAHVFTNPLGESVELGWLGIPLTIFWIVGVTNAVNLIDGLDGLAVGMGTISSLSLCLVSAISGEPMVAVLSLVLAGASLGFVPFNFYPARIFLGDTGSMFLGFMLASLGVLGSLKATTATVLILPLVVLGVPVFDTLWAILRRTSRRVSPFKPDRDHIHHRLVRIGLHHRQVVLVLYFVCLFLGVSAYIIVQLPYQMGFLFVALLALSGVLGVGTLKYVEENLEERLLAASGDRGAVERKTPPPESAASLWQATNGRGSSVSAGFQISVCEIGRFRNGLSASTAFGSVAEQVREVLGRRLKVYGVGAYMQEDRTLLLVLKTEQVDGDGYKLIRDGLTRFFEEWGRLWGDNGSFPEFRWIRRLDVSEKAEPVGVPSDN